MLAAVNISSGIFSLNTCLFVCSLEGKYSCFSHVTSKREDLLLLDCKGSFLVQRNHSFVNKICFICSSLSLLTKRNFSSFLQLCYKLLWNGLYLSTWYLQPKPSPEVGPRTLFIIFNIRAQLISPAIMHSRHRIK